MGSKTVSIQSVGSHSIIGVIQASLHATSLGGKEPANHVHLADTDRDQEERLDDRHPKHSRVRALLRCCGE